MLNSKPIISFFHGKGFPSYISRDKEILCRYFPTSVEAYCGLSSIYLMYRSVLRTKISIVWFANELTALIVFMCRVFRKKSIVITGGSMVLSEKYKDSMVMGGTYRWSHRLAAKYVAKAASVLLPVSQYELEGIIKNHNPREIWLCYHGFDYDKYYPSGNKTDMVLTTSESINREYFKRKNLDQVLQVAEMLPDLKFVILGKFMDPEIEKYMRTESPPNITYPGYVSTNELLNYFRKAKVYLQISRQEGFGCAIAEAMLCECTPVVSYNASIPEVVGSEGYYISSNNPENIAKAIGMAISHPKGEGARKRIISEFPIEKREAKLKKIINKLLS